MPTRGHGRAIQVEDAHRCPQPTRGRSWTRDRRFPSFGEKYKYEGRERHKEIGETEIVRVTRWFRETVCAWPRGQQVAT